MRDYASLTVDDAAAIAVAHGRRLPAAGLEGDGPWALLDASGSLLAMCERRGDALQPVVVLAAAGGSPGATTAGGGAGAPER